MKAPLAGLGGAFLAFVPVLASPEPAEPRRGDRAAGAASQPPAPREASEATAAPGSVGSPAEARGPGEAARVTVLENGLRLIVAPRPGRATGAIVASVHSGSAGEDPLYPGIAHFVEQMVVLHGPEFYDGRHMARELARLGAYANGHTDYDWTTVEFALPREWLDLGLDLSRETLLHAAIPAGAVDGERDAVYRERLAEDEDPWERALSLARRALYGQHPYGRHVLGPEGERPLDAITRDDLYRHYRRHYTPANMTLVVVADLEPDDMIERVRERFGRYRKAEAPERRVPPVEPPAELRTAFEERDLDGQAYIVLAFLGPPARDPDRLPLEVLLAALGQGRNSILFRSLVVQRALASAVWARLYPRVGPSLASIGVALPPSRIQPAVDEIRRKIAIVARDGLGPDFELGRSRLRNDYTFRYQKNLAWARGIAEADAIDDVASFLRYRERLGSVRPERIPEVARRYLQIDHAALTGLVPRGTPSSDYEVPRGARLAREVSRDPVPGELGVVAECMPQSEIVAAEVRIRGGSAADPPEQAGIAAFVARLVLRGHAELRGEAFAARLEALGARAEVGAGRDAASIRFAAPASTFPDVLTEMAAAVCRPAFVERESVDRDLEVVRREIEGEALFAASRGPGIADRIFWANAFLGTPYEREPWGDARALEAVDRDAAAAYWRAHYRADRILVSVAGPRPVRELEVWIRSAFRALPPPPPGEAEPPPMHPPPFSVPPRLGSPYRPQDRSTEQVTLVVAYALPPADPGRFPATALLAHVLDGGMHSPLWSLREEGGYAYAMGAEQIQDRYGGCLRVRLVAPDERAEGALSALRGAIEALRDRGLTAEDLQRAQESFLGRWARAREDPRYRARCNADFVGFGWPASYARRLEDAVRAVTPAVFARTAGEILAPGREWIMAVGRDAVRRFSRPPAPPPPAPRAGATSRD